MSSDFDLFIQSQKSNDIDQLSAKVEELMPKKGGAREVDPRFWDPKMLRDATGAGRALIRLLPSPDKDGTPYVRVFKHQWKNPATGGYYKENSLKTIGLADPVFDYNTPFMNSQDPAIRKNAIPRSVKYYCNILVIDDSTHPENNGRVFLMEYGGQIQDKIDALMHPEFQKDPKVNPFNIFEGADLVIRVTTKKVGTNDLPQYDSSSFNQPSPISADPVKTIKELFPKLYSLKEFTDPANFKTYEELQKRLNQVLGTVRDANPGNASTQRSAQENETVRSSAQATPAATAVAQETAVEDSIPWDSAEASTDLVEGDSGDDDAFFSQFK